MFALLLPGFLIIRTFAPAGRQHKTRLDASEEKTFEVWTNFLADGTQTWSTKHAPPFTEAIKTTIWQVMKTDTQAERLPIRWSSIWSGVGVSTRRGSLIITRVSRLTWRVIEVFFTSNRRTCRRLTLLFLRPRLKLSPARPRLPARRPKQYRNRTR